MSKQYEDSGVSLERGYESVRRIKSLVEQTKNVGVMKTIGQFGGLFDLSAYNIPDPVLVSGTDGVGTKLLIAQQANIHNTVGIDLVAMCVNDIITLGAKPLFFLDYIATGTIDPNQVEAIVEGIADGCVQAGCALIGGETAEMPDMYQGGHYDLAGYTTGVVSKQHIIDGSDVQEGDTIIGLPSSGIHSNGFSLVRKIVLKDNNLSLQETYEPFSRPLQEELLEPTKIYVNSVLSLIDNVKVKSIAHITGGGFHENIPRALPENLGAVINESSLPQLPIFSFLQRHGTISKDEMYHVFNMGIGMIVIVGKEDTDKALKHLRNSGEEARVIGTVNPVPGVIIR